MPLVQLSARKRPLFVFFVMDKEISALIAAYCNDSGRGVVPLLKAAKGQAWTAPYCQGSTG